MTAKRTGFTLIELLVVIAIMGLMGTVSVNGYRAMQRGIEERGVMQNVNQFIRSAYQRAQIDRQPVAIYFWNETLAEETDYDQVHVVGRAVAVRRAGRFTKVQGNYLADEFGDLSYNRLVLDGSSEESADPAGAGGSGSAGTGFYIYRMNGDEGSQAMRTLVGQTTVSFTASEPLLLNGGGLAAQIKSYAYEKLGGNASWKAGDAYGFEFADIELPQGYIFGSTFSRSVSSPIAGETVLRFKVSANSGGGANQGTDGASTIVVSALRPDAGGNLSAFKVASSDSPTKSLY